MALTAIDVDEVLQAAGYSRREIAGIDEYIDNWKLRTGRRTLREEELDDLLVEYGAAEAAPVHEFDPTTLPSRRDVDIPGGGGYLEFRFRRTDGSWTPWEGSYNRKLYHSYEDIYGSLQLVASSRYDDYDGFQARIVELPDVFGHEQVFAGKVNCAKALLVERFASCARKLRQIKDDNGWGLEQDEEASKIIKRNIVRRNAADEEVYRVGNFKTVAKKPDYVYYAIEQHAVKELPERRKSDRVLTYPEGVTKAQVYARVKTRFDPRAIAFPAADGLQVVHSGPKGEVVRTALRSQEGWDRVQKRARELGVDPEDVYDLGSEFGVETLAWRRRCGFESTEKKYAEAVEASIIYPVPYSAGVPRAEVAEAGYDLNGAYWGAIRKSEYYAAYGMPGGQAVCLEDPEMTVLGKTGFVLAQLVAKHPYAKLQLRGQARSWVSTMRLQSWLDKDWVEVVKLERVILYAGRWPEAIGGALCVAGKSEKTWGREAIGRLVAKHGDSGTYLTHDDREASWLCHTLQAQGRLRTVKRVDADGAKGVEAALRDAGLLDREDDETLWARMLEGLSPLYPAREEDAPNDPEGIWEIGAGGESKTGCFHVHAYFLDYAATVLEGQLAKYRWEDVARVYTDCILLKRGVSYGDIDEGAELGQWKREARVRDDGRDRYSEKPYVVGEPRPVPSLDGYKWWEPLAHPISLIEGPPGYGKTYACLEKVPDCVVLAPTHKLRKKAHRQGHTAMTWQYALWPLKEFDEERVRVPRGRVVFITEVFMIPLGRLKVILEFLREKGFRVLMDGDREQMRPFEGEFAAKYLAEATAKGEIHHQWHAGKDYRSSDQDTADAKMAMRGRDNLAAVWQLRDMGLSAEYRQFLEDWHPRDYVLVTVHTLRDRIHRDLERVHRAKYPEEKRRVRYGHGPRMAGGKSAPRNLVGEEEFIGLRQKIPAGAELAYSTTYSVCQGDTIESPTKVWMFDYRLHSRYQKAIYMGFTRVRELSQAMIVNPPLDLLTSLADDDLIEDHLVPASEGAVVLDVED